MDPRNGGDLLCSQEGVHSVPRLGRQEVETGPGRCPVEVGGGEPQGQFRVPAGRDDEEELGAARALLPGDFPSVVRIPGPGERGGQARVCPAAGRVRGRWECRTSSGLPGERLAHDGVRGGRPGAVVYRVGRPGADGRLGCALDEYCDFVKV